MQFSGFASWCRMPVAAAAAAKWHAAFDSLVRLVLLEADAWLSKKWRGWQWLPWLASLWLPSVGVSVFGSCLLSNIACPDVPTLSLRLLLMLVCAVGDVCATRYAFGIKMWELLTAARPDQVRLCSCRSLMPHGAAFDW